MIPRARGAAFVGAAFVVSMAAVFLAWRVANGEMERRARARFDGEVER